MPGQLFLLEPTKQPAQEDECQKEARLLDRAYRSRGFCRNALLKRSLQAHRLLVLLEEVGKRLIGNVLKAASAFAGPPLLRPRFRYQTERAYRPLVVPH